MIKPPAGLGVFAWKRLILTFALMLILNGVLSWFVTPQEEDPKLANRSGILTVIVPGSLPNEIERLVTKPIEDELATVSEIKRVTSTMRTDFVFMKIELGDEIASESALLSAWDQVQKAIDRAERKLPPSAMKPNLNKEVYDQDAVLLAMYGVADPLVLLDQTRILKDRLQAISTVKKIDEISSPGEQLSVTMNNQKLKENGVSLDNLVTQLRGGNAAVPSGYIHRGEKKITVLTNSIYRSADELAKFPVVLASGDVLPLSTFAQISRTVALPMSESMRFNGERAMAIGVVARNHVKLQAFGDQVRKVVEDFKASSEVQKAGIKIAEVSYQPHYVEERIRDIMFDLLKAIFLVGGVLMLMLGFRVGSIVALQVPLVTAVAFGIFSYSGGVLNQISIAAFILAIGLLVDNVVVVVDGIQDKLDRGLPPIKAGEETRKEFLIPLAAGTLTTIAAFMPILMSKGVSADFTRAIGVVATIALIFSYIFCIFVTPIIAAALLRKGKARQWHFVEPLGARLGALVVNHSRLIALGGLAAVVIAVACFRFVPKQFFPFADRDLLIVEMQLPEGTHYRTTEERALLIEQALRKYERVVAVSTFIGRGVPLFYYNLPMLPNAPHIAQFIVRTRNAAEAKTFKREKEGVLAALVPTGIVLVREIAQGPPIKAPIEVRVRTQDPLHLQNTALKVLGLTRQAEGVRNVRSTMGVGMMNYRFDVNDTAASSFGATRAVVASVLLANTRGIPITTYRGGRDPYSITLRSNRGEDSTKADLESAYVGSTRTESITVGLLTNESLEFSPAVIEHRDRVPEVSILAELAPGASEVDATESVRQKIATLPITNGVTVELGGASAESKSANASIFMALPIGLFVLLLSLMFEFNSFRRVGIILLTVPLCAVGSVPGLILSGSTFGFITLLGFFTLAGTVIHNGIFLLDYMDHRIHEGVKIDDAIVEGIQRRTRPIILTAVATIVELLPMTMSASTLWPPFAWAIISGLAVSTLMTLLVIPSVYKIAFTPKSSVKKSRRTVATVAFVVLALGTSSARAEEASDPGATDREPSGRLVSRPAHSSAPAGRPISIQSILDQAVNGPEALSAKDDAEKADRLATAFFRATYIPKLFVLGSYSHLTSNLAINNPIAGFTLPAALSSLGAANFPLSQDSLYARVQMMAPLITPSSMFFENPAKAQLAEAALLKSHQEIKDVQQKALGFYLDTLELRAKRKALENFVSNLQSRQIEVRRLYDLGRVSEASLLKTKLGAAGMREDIQALSKQIGAFELRSARPNSTLNG